MKQFPGKRKEPATPALDVILMILTAAHAARPNAAFITSLLQQYRERGGLSKKQLEGLLSKAGKIEEIPAAHMATLQAIILKKTTRHKSEVTTNLSQPKEDTDSELIMAILDKYPSHKQALFLKTKKESKQELTQNEKEELKRFHKLLIKS